VFRIKSVDDGTVFELGPYDNDYFLASVSATGIRAQARVGRYMAQRLDDLFAYLAANWKGWTGERTWESLEGELRLAATCDRTGHVRINIHLHDGAPALWKVNTSVMVEAGQLERLAEEAVAFDREFVSAV
jgi:hypothetical protein